MFFVVPDIKAVAPGNFHEFARCHRVGTGVADKGVASRRAVPGNQGGGISFDPKRKKRLRVKPERYKCPSGKWDFAYSKERCCPGCATLLLIASDLLSDAELMELRSFWMWEPLKERWDYIRDWVEHKRQAMHRFDENSKARIRSLAVDQPTRRSLTKWIQ
jgi:hypothetical protein